MDHDDAQTGHVLSRRDVLRLLGTAGVTVIGGRFLLADAPHALGAMLPSCVVRPEQTAGPYFVDATLDRSDIRSDPTNGSPREGVRLDLAFQVSRVGAGECQPLAGAMVDVWQCDALGIYSGVRDINGRFDTTGEKFLRGHQVTDANGTARFVTIYPGWYEGRTVHIHFMVRTAPVSDRVYEFTSQLYFDDAVTDEVMREAPYASKGQRTIRNERDGIFRRGGDQLMLAVTPRGNGYRGTFEIGLQLG